MMLDESVIGTTVGPFTLDVDGGRVRAFAEAIGEPDPIHRDPGAARAAGLPGVLVPPTFLFCLDLETGTAWQLVDRLGVDHDQVLHGEQHFTYHHPVHAGDRLELQTEVTDVSARRGGALNLVGMTTRVRRAGRLVAELHSVLVVRMPEVVA